MNNTLSVEKLIKIYNKKVFVNKVSLHVESGKVVGLLGPNGAGKTTTFYMTTGMIKSDGGRVLLNNEDLTHAPMFRRARKGIGYLPQESSIFKKLSVYQNIAAILELGPLARQKIKERAFELMEELGISRLKNRQAGLLSGGERGRLEIARALALNPGFILLDEPFAGIDPLAVIDIQEIISQLAKKGIGVLISDHNVRETLGVCDNAYILSSGEVIESGPPEKIADSELAKKIYLGESFKL